MVNAMRLLRRVCNDVGTGYIGTCWQLRAISAAGRTMLLDILLVMFDSVQYEYISIA